MGLVLVTPPAGYPVTLDEVKSHCRIDGLDDDALLTGLIAAATDYVELYTGRAIVSQTWRATFDAFANSVMLSKGPVSAVSQILYTDMDGVAQVASTDLYTLDNASDPAWVVLNSGEAWPLTLDAVNAVSITFVCGYSTVPQSIRLAILMLVSEWYDARASDAQMPMAVTALLTNYRSFS